MLTSVQIAAAAASLDGGHLSATAQQQWLTLIRSLPEYRQQPGLYPNLAQRLANATGLTAQVLQAALTQIEAVGAGAESFGSAASAGVAWSREDNRREFVEDGLNVLYDAPVRRSSSAVVRASDGWCSVHRCGYAVCSCSAVGDLIL